MADYLIVAQDEIYRGKHGVENWTIEECSNEHEAFALGRDMSLELIDSYADIYESFKENAEYWADQEEEERGRMFTEEDREKYITEAIEAQRKDDIRYRIWKLSDRFDYSKLISSEEDWQDIEDCYDEEEI